MEQSHPLGSRPCGRAQRPLGRACRQAVMLLCTLALGLGACGDTLLGGDPAQDPVANFDALWQSFDRHYAHFTLKKLDWDGLYAQYRPKVHRDMSEEELFDVMGAMLAHLKDGHVYLTNGTRHALSDRYLFEAPLNYNRLVVNHYLLPAGYYQTAAGQITYGWVAPGIGYMNLASLAGGEGAGGDVSGWVRDVEISLRAFEGTQAMILDLRHNPGGRAFNAQFLAGHFATARKPFVRTQSRNGPGYDDFSALRTWYVEPNIDKPYTRPIVVLTNRFTFSAAEWLLLALKEFDHVTQIGTETGGGLAMFLPRELPNGWTYTVSVQKTHDARGQLYEIVGIPPDIRAEIAAADTAIGRDAILETAVEFLGEKTWYQPAERAAQRAQATP